MFRKILFTVFVLAALAAVPAVAQSSCNGACAGNQCIKSDVQTGMMCYVSSIGDCVETLCGLDETAEAASWLPPQELTCRVPEMLFAQAGK